MKNKKFNLAIIMMVVAAIISVAVVSCKKEDNKTTKSETQVDNMSSIDNMDEYLISFKNKLLSAQKGEETISLEQAERDLGNLLNFDFGDANYASNVFHLDTLNAQLVVKDGMVDLYQLAITYNEAFTQIAKAYESVNLPEKSVYTISCSIQQDGNVVLVLTTRGIVSHSGDSRNITINPDKTGFNPSDCWSVYFGLGNCDGTDLGYDHVSVLQLVYHNNLGVLGCINGQVYYTDISYGTFDALNYAESGNPSFNQGYRMWVGNDMEFHYGSVPYNEMVYYYDNLCDILNERLASLNDDEYRITRISCTIVQNNDNLSQFRFLCKYEYGKPHCSGNGGDI